jgi:hypothetical protein
MLFQRKVQLVLFFPSTIPVQCFLKCSSFSSHNFDHEKRQMQTYSPLKRPSPKIHQLAYERRALQ